MPETCPTCGLPPDLCACEDLARTEGSVTVAIDERRYGKEVTVVEGFASGTDLETLASDLKSALACGGTVREDRIELQGDHRGRIGDALADHGFEVEPPPGR
ncbi:MAG: translation initiation factor [Halobacteriales archaeon]